MNIKIIEVRDIASLTLSNKYHNIRTQPYLDYVQNLGNRDANLGRWNGNFACWENVPGCGRDFE